MKKIINCILISMLIVSLQMTQSVSASENGFTNKNSKNISVQSMSDGQTSGSCGANVKWSFDEKNGCLTLTGSGKMNDYSSAAPWYEYCSDIKKIKIQEGITVIGEGAFYECENLESIELPDTVTTLKEGCFADCTSLESIKTGINLTTIEDYAFQNTRIKTFDLGKNIKKISAKAFFIGDLENFDVDAENSTYTSIDGILYTKNKQTLVCYPNGKEVGNYKVSDTATKIGEYAFYAAPIKEIILPDSIKTIENSAFALSKITKLVIPDSVTSIGEWAAESCEALDTVTIGNGLKHLSEYAFNGCSKLTKISLGKIEKIDKFSFSDCGLLSLVELPNTLKVIDSYAFENTAIQDIDIPKSVYKINEYAFPSTTNVHQTHLTALSKGAYLLQQSVDLKTTDNYTYAFEVLKLVNQERAKKKLSALSMDKELLDAAMTRAHETTIYFSHTRPNSLDCFSISSKMEGENIAVGQYDPKSVMNSWMNSSGHKANILNKEAKSIGIGVTKIDGTYYWVQCFSSSKADKVSQNTYKNSTSSRNVTFSTYGDDYNHEFYPELSIEYDYDEKNNVTMLTYFSFYNGFKNTEIPINQVKYTFSDPSSYKMNKDGTIHIIKSVGGTLTASLKKYPEVKATCKIPKVKIPTAKKSIAKATIKADLTVYTGKSVKPKLKVQYGSTVLKLGKDYKINYINKKNNKNTGYAYVMVQGIGKYNGSKTVRYIIVPKKTSITKCTSSKKTIIVQYKKTAGTSGYQIAYQQRNSSKWKYSYTAAMTKRINNLSSKKYYNIKVRPYKTIGKNKYYGTFTKIQSVKVK